MADRIEARLRELGLELPERCTPRGNFLPYRIENNIVFMSGQICEWNDVVLYAGPVVDDLGATGTRPAGLSLDAGRKAAEVCALNLLFHLRTACEGSLDRIRTVLRVGGFVNCLSGFGQSPAVINGASDLFIALLGEDGRHARTAVGVCGLPGNAAVEVDAIFLIR